MSVRVKICGLTRPEHVHAVTASGARYCGFVFFAKSPRNVGLSVARDLALLSPAGLCKVALVVDADDEFLDEMLEHVPIDMLQLHGRETPERVAQIRNRYGLPVMKAVGVATAEDLPRLDTFAEVADQLLVDAKPAPGGELPGGNGVSFDWRLIAGRDWTVPWMLAGGLTSENVAEAIRLTGARQVDVSSGVESAPGEKDAALIERFVTAATSAG